MARKAKPNGKASVDWAALMVAYVSSFDVSLEDLAKQHGVASHVVRRRAAKEDWTGQRKAYEGRAVSEALRDAFKDKKNAIKALLRLEYNESLSHAQQLINERREKGESWKPGMHKSHADTFGLLMNRVRLSLGLPSEIGAWPDDSDHDLVLLYAPENAK